MPAKSKAQQRFMGAELARKRAGKRTETGMSEQQLRDFASTALKGLPKKMRKSTKGSPSFTRRDMQKGYRRACGN
ncbi:MAG: DUF3008 family protein [Alphaproteobacteria bacterium]|nr:DUF3008 family protein [Alphaproteobacteria bacterium]